MRDPVTKLTTNNLKCFKHHSSSFPNSLNFLYITHVTGKKPQAECFGFLSLSGFTTAGITTVEKSGARGQNTFKLTVFYAEIFRR